MEKYGKTILSAYPLLDGYITEIEGLIKKRARNSFYLRCDTVAFAEQLIRLGEIRKDLFELKFIVEEVLASLNSYDRTLISYKYFGVRPEDENFDLSSRNYFRKQIKALDNFCKRLESMGYVQEWFQTKYLKIAFISSIYKTTLLEEGKKHVRENYY
ncbi:MAG: hypothetical protein IJA97_01370 [Clostridia bacterium]|nr:hypothetical protein [Clostridia bacterium]